MPDETTTTLEPQTTEGGLPHDPQVDTQAAHDAAEQFLAATRSDLEGQTPPDAAAGTPVRDEKGRFAKKDATPPQDQAPAMSVEPPAVDPVWKELAKAEGLPEDQIETFQSEADIETAITTNRVQKMQQAATLLGINPQQYHQYMQWQQQYGQSAPQGQQPPEAQQTQPPPTVEELKLDLDEDELDPKVLATIKALAGKVNQLGTVATENQKLSQKLAELEGYVRQSALQAQAAQQQAVYAESWDKAAAKIPGFSEYFGKPSDLLRLAQTQPNHQRIRDYVGFDAHFQPVWQNYVNRVGENDTALYLALRDAWNASPYSKLAPGTSRNGTNGNGSAHVQQGVVRQTARRTGPRETGGDAIDAEMNRTLGTIAEAWDRKGENPFKDLGI